MFGSALQVARQAAIELGLPSPGELVTSQEATSIQLLGLLHAAGSELVMYFDWQHLLKTHVITSQANVAQYPAPADFGHMINQTMWDKNMRRPAYGPVSPQGWQVLTNALVTAGPFVRYRVVGGTTEFLPVPTAANLSYNYQYISNAWVQSYTDPNQFNQFILNDKDTLYFEFWLLVKFLKLKMWQAKGLDTTSLVNDFTRVFEAVTGQDHGAPVLGLAPNFKTPWLTIFNTPDGNWNTGPQ